MILNIINKTKKVLKTKKPDVAVTLGLPKRPKTYGNGVLIVAVKNVFETIKNTFNTCKIIFTECEVKQCSKLLIDRLAMGCQEAIKSFNNLSKCNVNDIYRDIICNRDVLIESYHKVSKKNNANIPGINYETLDSLRKSLLDHTFKFKPIRKIEISKASGGIQILGIPSFRDKIVQRTMVTALEYVYENKIFLNSSHGFRPKKSPHSAIRQVTLWTGTRWFIEGDISKCFDAIDHHILAKLLQKEIKSKPFLDLYWKAVRSHYINVKTKMNEFSIIGTLQGSIVSPILANIYLHEFDNFMEKKVKDSQNSGTISITSPEYKKIHNKISNFRQYFSKNYRRNRSLTQKQDRLKKFLKLEKTRAKIASTLRGKGYRLYYIRYADDFIVGINGTEKLSIQIKEEINTFLLEKLKLTLNVKKTNIIRSDKGTIFLGALLKRYTSRTNDQPRWNNSKTQNSRKIRVRVPQGRIHALVPLEKVVKRLQFQGICKIRNFNKREVIPTRKTAWVNFELEEIICKFNRVWTSLLNYYSFAYNRCQLNFIQYLLQHSLACTFMNKLKLSSRRKVFRRFGNAITVETEKKGKTISFKLEKSFKRINKPFRNFSIFYKN